MRGKLACADIWFAEVSWGTFPQVWPQTTEQLSGMPPYTNTRDVDLFTAERGFTVWRPQVPFGYLSLGDVITQGSKLPRHHAACIAKDSGLTAAPQDYQLVMTEGDLCIWTPVPPAGEPCARLVALKGALWLCLH
jgi:hypothetical protein